MPIYTVATIAWGTVNLFGARDSCSCNVCYGLHITGWHFTLLLNALSPELNLLVQQWQIGWRHCRSVAVALQLVSSGRLQVVFHHYRSAEHNTQRIILFKPRAAWKPAPGQIESQKSHLSDSPTDLEVVLNFASVSDFRG